IVALIVRSRAASYSDTVTVRTAYGAPTAPVPSELASSVRVGARTGDARTGEVRALRFDDLLVAATATPPVSANASTITTVTPAGGAPAHPGWGVSVKRPGARRCMHRPSAMCVSATSRGCETAVRTIRPRSYPLLSRAS